MQLHNVPKNSLTQETEEVVGNIIGTTIRVADLEDDGEGCEFLRVMVAMNITKPLPCCCKLRSEGKHIGWALLKFERLLNFCYWCGRVDHVEKDCVRFGLRIERSLEKRINSLVTGCGLSSSNRSVNP